MTPLDTAAPEVQSEVAYPAIEPKRVLVFNEDEQNLLLESLCALDPEEYPATKLLHERIARGEEYADATDQLARVTLRKRRLEDEVRRCNRAIDGLEQLVVEKLVADGTTGMKHAATGVSLSMTQKVWAKVVREGEKPTDDEKAAAGQALIDADLGNFVKPGFNTNSVSAYFRELFNNHLEEQRDLPEHKRNPQPVSAFLPAELQGFIELTNDPAISVTR